MKYIIGITAVVLCLIAFAVLHEGLYLIGALALGLITAEVA
jgi:hypothetical protein